MPRVARAVVTKIDTFPWYEWTEEFEWEDDEFEDRRRDDIQAARDRTGRLESWDCCEDGLTDDTSKNKGIKGEL